MPGVHPVQLSMYSWLNSRVHSAKAQQSFEY